MAKDTENAEKRLLLRMPGNLWSKAKKQAKANNRSLNGEILQILSEAILGK